MLESGMYFRARWKSQEIMMGYAQTAAARCSQCDGLRKECSAALGEYIRILAERNAARKRRDHDLVEAFEDIESESLQRAARRTTTRTARGPAERDSQGR